MKLKEKLVEISKGHEDKYEQLLSLSALISLFNSYEDVFNYEITIDPLTEKFNELQNMMIKCKEELLNQEIDE